MPLGLPTDLPSVDGKIVAYALFANESPRLGHISSSNVVTPSDSGACWLQNLALNMLIYLHGACRDPLKSGGIEEPARIFHHTRPWLLSPCLSLRLFGTKGMPGSFDITVHHHRSSSTSSSRKRSYGSWRVQRN